MPDIQRCSRFTQIGISSSVSNDSDDWSLISSSDDDDTDIDAIEMIEELDDDDDDSVQSVALFTACRVDRSIFCVK